MSLGVVFRGGGLQLGVTVCPVNYGIWGVYLDLNDPFIVLHLQIIQHELREHHTGA